MSNEVNSTRKRRIISFMIGAVLVLGALFVWVPTILVNLTTRDQRYDTGHVDMADIPEREVAIVFGAALRNRGTDPSNYLRWRIETAVQLYHAGRVEKLLMTGDGSRYDHDEPYIMQREAIALGVPAEDIIMDKFGFDTYDSCSRAVIYRDVSSAIVVTQGYHLPRAVFSCKSVGIDTIGVSAVSHNIGWTPYEIMREWLSTDKLFVQLFLRRFE